MAEVRNLARGERIIRAMIGGLLVVMSFYLSGFWRPFILVIGLFVLFTVFAGY
jgi:hypothetical protein